MRNRVAMTLAELVVVLTVLAAMAGLLVPLFTSTVQDANAVVARSSLVHVRDAVMQYWSDGKYVALDGVTTVASDSNRLQIRWLFQNPVTGDRTMDFDPNTRIGWRGPYIAQSTADLIEVGPNALIDPWNRVVEIQDVDPSAAVRDVRIVSGGPDGMVAIPTATATNLLTASDIGDDVYVAVELR